MQSFDDLASDYDRMASLAPAPYLPWIEAHLPVHGGRALDAGCGSGHTASLLAQRYDQVVGVDISRPMIEIAKTQRCSANIEYRVGDLMEFDDSDGFDVVLSCCVLHHLPILERALHHLRKLVRIGGIAIVIDNISWTATPPRWIHVFSAWRHLPFDVVTQGWRDARWMFAYRTSARWLDHLAGDRYLTRTTFRSRYGTVFPGARFASFGWAEGLVWGAA